jgi:ABC-type Fe3+ transport system permease subunit
MLSITTIAPGEVGMGEMLLGIVIVGVGVGIWIGRQSERARRSYKDVNTAKTALKKGRTIAVAEIRKMALIVVVVGGVLVAVFIGMMQAPR